MKRMTEALDAQLVVIGGGGAGLPAAIAAVENGASSVIVLEKRSVSGGNAARAWGLFAAESWVQKQAMVDARKEQLFKTIMDWSHWQIDPEIFRAFIWKSADTIRWLEEKGIKFNLPRYFPNQEPPVWHVPEGRGARLMEVLAAICLERGVQLWLNTRCKKILKTAEGNINGVLAEKEGKDITITTRGVVIASGGYAGNPELLRKYCPYFDDHIRCFGIPHDGDGLIMADEIGADTASLGHLLLEWPHVHNDPSSILASAAREPYTVYVNKRGKRFTDETNGLHAFESANAILQQPEKTGFILFDDAIRRSMEETGVVLGRGNDREERRRGIPGLEKQLISAAENNPARVKASTSWPDIADWIGADPKVLKGALDRYNSFCDQGYDAEFAKDRRYLLALRTPPYYAIKGELIFLNTLGGLKINEKMEVINRKGDPIPGLYSAGADTGGWEPQTYCDRLSGTALGFSINSGRIAGENAASFVRNIN
jgi:fumarate reductase flavoprotein subunit